MKKIIKNKTEEMEETSNIYRSKRKELDMLKALKEKKFIDAKMAPHLLPIPNSTK